jgi:cell division protein FtsB
MSNLLNRKIGVNLLRVSVVGFTLLILFHTILGQDNKRSVSPCDCQCSPETIQDHYNLAKAYHKKADEYYQEAEAYYKKIDDLKKQHANNSRSRLENPTVIKLKKQYEQMVEQNEATAREAEKFADYHYFRAMELSGK